MVTKSSTRVGKSFVLIDRSVAVCASGRIGNVVPDSNEPLEIFLSSGESLDDEGMCLPKWRPGFEFVWLEGFFGRANDQFCVRKRALLVVGTTIPPALTASIQLVSPESYIASSLILRAYPKERSKGVLHSRISLYCIATGHCSTILFRRFGGRGDGVLEYP